ncbi:DUF397 domain-containing protein [Streptomyces uncialis]|uniref:DUF397 domain-containing protein n=1 Tax=Streptomyces uncialis TaxID=1048205 RepID=UPI003866C02E|nr:DUF397 domain-containing protein [Streptomyces uncialis]
MKHDEIQWQKSTHSSGGDGGQCIEIATEGDTVLLRESDTPGTVVTTTPEKLRAFLLGIKAGEFDHFTEAPPEG